MSAGSAAYTTNALSAGVRTFYADYSGDSANNPAAAPLVLAIGSSSASLSGALDNAGLTFIYDGGTGWSVTTSTSTFGGSAVQSAAITHNQSTFLATVFTGPGTLRFYWKVSSETNYDYLRLLLDGVDQGGAISGNVDWVQRTLTIPAGIHTVSWQYSKDGSVNVGSDAGWVDKVEFLPPGNTYSASLEPGFNMIGNSLNLTLNVATVFGNQDAPVAGVTPNIVSIWKWNAVDGRWAFYSPQLTAAAIAAFAASKNYEVLATINPGEGYWVNAIGSFALPAQTGTDFNWSGFNFGALPSGFNLIAQSNVVSPSQFNVDVSPTPPAPGVVPTDNFVSLWAWNAAQASWYFYSPLLESSGGLTAVKNYADSHFFLHFDDSGKMLGIGTGFWVNRP